MKKHGIYMSPNTDDKRYLKVLIDEVIEKVDTIRIDCWNEDEKTIIEELSELNGGIDKSFPNMTIFNFKANEINKQGLIYSAIGENKVRWFSLFLKNKDQTIFASEHYGSEIVIYELDDIEYQEFLRLIPENSNHIEF